jgi:creatinine amidohydrolase
MFTQSVFGLLDCKRDVINPARSALCAGLAAANRALLSLLVGASLAAGTLDCSRMKPSPAPAPPGVLLENLTWIEAEKRLGPATVMVIPIGAAAKEHGPHLRLANDRLLADYFTQRVIEAADVVAAPTVTYHHYPAFHEYPGSVSLRSATARDLMVDICTSLAAYGPRRFYALNTGVSTVGPLAAAAEVLGKEGILLTYTDLGKVLGPVEARIAKQEGGGHADEIETSMMLVIAPGTVDMSKAVKDYDPRGDGLTRTPGGEGTYSPTGTWGDPTLATREKGEIVITAMVTSLLGDIESLRRSPLPPGR